MNKKLVAGVGLYEKGGKYPSKLKGVVTREYNIWRNMLLRCYSEKTQTVQPTYISCQVSENFKNFQFFAEWCNNQVGFKSTNYHLDKDIVFKGNRLYSENTCFFVPREINNFFTKREVDRGKCPIGVGVHKNTGLFQVNTSEDGRMLYLGLFHTAEEAFYAYKLHKENKAKQLAYKYRESVHIDVITALRKYVVEITD